MSRRFFGVLALLTLALPLLAKNPNFSGVWKLSQSKSDFGQMPAPDSIIYKVEQDDATLKNETKQASSMGDFDLTSKYALDQSESKNTGFGGVENTSTVKFEGEIMVIETKGSFGDTPYTMTQRWTLSSDGKQLTVIQKFKSAMAEGQQKMVFDKQQSK